MTRKILTGIHNADYESVFPLIVLDSFRSVVMRCKWEIIKEVERLRNWNIDFRDLRGTNVKIYQGDEDRVVDPRNADDWYEKLTRAGVRAELKKRKGGHLLLKQEAEEIATGIGTK